MDPEPDPDPTPFFIDFRDAQKYVFLISFLITCPQAHNLQCKKFNFVLKFYVKMFLQGLIQSAQHIYEKSEGSGAGSGAGSGSVPLTNGSGSGSGRPKNMRILRIWIRFRIRIPNTAFNIFPWAALPTTSVTSKDKLPNAVISDL
jgi:hypothetical protein